MFEEENVCSEMESQEPAFISILHTIQDTPSKHRKGSRNNWRVTWRNSSHWLTLQSRIVLASLNVQPLPSPEEVVSQAKVLCREYIYCRLKKLGLLTLKLEVQISPGSKPSDVSMEIQKIGAELERMYPHLYHSISQQINVTFSMEKIVRRVFLTIGDTLFKHGVVTWGRVIALFAVASGLAIDCIQQGHPQFIQTIVDTFADIADKHLVRWMTMQGGWPEILRAFKTNNDASTLMTLTGIGAITGFVVTLLALLRF